MESRNKKYIADSASLIEVPTEFVRNDVIKYLNVNPDKVKVVGRFIRRDFGNKTYDEPLFDFPYVLYMGRRDKYSCYKDFIRNIIPFLYKNTEVRLVMTGDDINEKDKEFFTKVGIADRILSVPSIKDKTEQLLQYAICHIYMDCDSGFSYNILNAVKCGCLNVVNSESCAAEMLGNAAIMYNYEDAKKCNLSDILQTVYENTEELKKISDILYPGIIEKYSIEAVSDRICELYDMLPIVRDNKETTDIFIVTHVDMKTVKCPKNDVYKILCGSDTEMSDVGLDVYREGETKITPKQFSYAEGSRIFWLFKNHYKDLKDYVGFCQYRKYFKFFDKIPNIDKLFSKYDIICGDNVFNDGSGIEYSLFEHYIISHNPDDLKCIMNIIYDYNPRLYNQAMKTFSSNVLYPSNMFIMKKEKFSEWVNFVFPILFRFDKINGIYNDEDARMHALNNKHKYVSKFDLKFQQRIDGFLLERLTQLFIDINFNKNRILTYPIKMGDKIESNYSTEK